SYANKELLEAPTSQLVRAIMTVVEIEAPLHMADLAARVAGMWGSRVGTRIMARVIEGCRAAEQGGLLIRRNEVVWRKDETCTVRSRSGTRILAERIAPEEYREAVLMVLRSGYGFSRTELTNEVRAVLGFNRTGPILEAAISNAVSDLLTCGVVGE